MSGNQAYSAIPDALLKPLVNRQWKHKASRPEVWMLLWYRLKRNLGADLQGVANQTRWSKSAVARVWREVNRCQPVFHEVGAMPAKSSGPESDRKRTSTGPAQPVAVGASVAEVDRQRTSTGTRARVPIDMVREREIEKNNQPPDGGQEDGHGNQETVAGAAQSGQRRAVGVVEAVHHTGSSEAQGAEGSAAAAPEGPHHQPGDRRDRRTVAEARPLPDGPGAPDAWANEDLGPINEPANADHRGEAGAAEGSNHGGHPGSPGGSGRDGGGGDAGGDGGAHGGGRPGRNDRRAAGGSGTAEACPDLAAAAPQQQVLIGGTHGTSSTTRPEVHPSRMPHVQAAQGPAPEGFGEQPDHAGAPSDDRRSATDGGLEQRADHVTRLCDLYAEHSRDLTRSGRRSTLTDCPGLREQWADALEVATHHGYDADTLLGMFRYIFTGAAGRYWLRGGTGNSTIAHGRGLVTYLLRCKGSTHGTGTPTADKLVSRLAAAHDWMEGLDDPEAATAANNERDDIWRYLRSEAADGTEELFADDPHLTPRAIAALAACGGSRALLGDIARGAKGNSLGFAWRSWKEAWAGTAGVAATTDTTDAARAARRTG